MAFNMQAQQRLINGRLWKRCRLSWRPRYVELVLNAMTGLSGEGYSFQLMIYDQHRRVLKDCIRMEEIVTIRSCCDCYFQIFLSSGKILQLKASTMELQAHWMAMIKVGLGRGCIFHVRVNTRCLEHALLYSIDVKLPAHRTGQLDRVLVLASPINDINLSAWDLNRVRRFIELDVGVRMDLCTSCVRGEKTTITFILDRKQFIKDCIKFLCSEAKISDTPSEENGLLVYNIGHECGFIKPPTTRPPPPPYRERNTAKQNATDLSTNDPQISSHMPVLRSATLPPNSESSQLKVTAPKMPLRSQVSLAANNESMDLKFTSQAPNTEFKISGNWESSSDQEDTGSGSGSFFPMPPVTTASKIDGLPPRTIARKNYEGAVPAVAHPYLSFQPHLYCNTGAGAFATPYQISSRIIISDSGEVQYERNVFGNVPQNRGEFQFSEKVVPPKGVHASPSPRRPSARSSSSAADLGGNSRARPVSNLTTNVRFSQKPTRSSTLIYENQSAFASNKGHSAGANPEAFMDPAESAFETNNGRLYTDSRQQQPLFSRRRGGNGLRVLTRTSSDSQLDLLGRSSAVAKRTREEAKDKCSSVIQSSIDDGVYIIPTTPIPIPTSTANGHQKSPSRDTDRSRFCEDASNSPHNLKVKFKSKTLPSRSISGGSINCDDEYIVMRGENEVFWKDQSGSPLQNDEAKRQKPPITPRKSVGSSSSTSPKRTRPHGSPLYADGGSILDPEDPLPPSGFQLQSSARVRLHNSESTAGRMECEVKCTASYLTDSGQTNSDVFMSSEEEAIASIAPDPVRPPRQSPVSPRRPVPKPRTRFKKKQPLKVPSASPETPEVGERMAHSTSEGNILEMVSCRDSLKRCKSTSSIVNDADA